MSDEERLDEPLRHMIDELDTPPVPRQEMWARITAERAARRTAAATPEIIPFRVRVRPVLAWSAALAATLAIGVGIGRLSNRTIANPDAVPVATRAADSTADTARDVVPAPFRLVANRHLQQTETLLTALTVDGGATGVDEVTSWARELLSNTRLLLASPAAQDPALRKLLTDLELLLAQVSTIPAARAEEEVELIQHGIHQSDVLLRLRAATSGRRLVGT